MPVLAYVQITSISHACLLGVRLEHSLKMNV